MMVAEGGNRSQKMRERAINNKNEQESMKMEQIIHDEKNGLDYERCGDYYLSCLKAPIWYWIVSTAKSLLLKCGII